MRVTNGANFLSKQVSIGSKKLAKTVGSNSYGRGLAIVIIGASFVVVGQTLNNPQENLHVINSQQQDSEKTEIADNFEAESTTETVDNNSNVKIENNEVIETSNNVQGATSKITIKSNVTTNNGDSHSSTQITAGDEVVEEKTVVTNEGEDGDSTVKFEFDVGSEAEVDIDERRGRYKIEIKEEKEN